MRGHGYGYGNRLFQCAGHGAPASTACRAAASSWASSRSACWHSSTRVSLRGRRGLRLLYTLRARARARAGGSPRAVAGRVQLRARVAVWARTGVGAVAGGSPGNDTERNGTRKRHTKAATFTQNTRPILAHDSNWLSRTLSSFQQGIGLSYR